ncbi:IS3 family transposase [Amycolatopsis sulphurea]|uniref:IS3 family transposase n=1 Tax=Amycolatopsis sulphurea TaxID=76022 RepID=UPI003C2C418F
MVGIARSRFYHWKASAKARVARRAADDRLAARIRAVHRESGGTYGVPRITAELRETGRTRSTTSASRGSCARPGYPACGCAASIGDPAAARLRICSAGTSPSRRRTRSTPATSRISRSRTGASSSHSNPPDRLRQQPQPDDSYAVPHRIPRDQHPGARPTAVSPCATNTKPATTSPSTLGATITCYKKLRKLTT